MSGMGLMRFSRDHIIRLAVAAQVTTENKLKVTAIEIRPAKKR
jgi:hypothetical protein